MSGVSGLRCESFLFFFFVFFLEGKTSPGLGAVFGIAIGREGTDLLSAFDTHEAAPMGAGGGIGVGGALPKENGELKEKRE